MNISLKDSDIGITYLGDYTGFDTRTAARAIIFNENRQVALLKVENGSYHKLPGGGVEEDEILEDALTRELIEEVGALVHVERKLGTIHEYRGEFKLTQESHFYICRLKEIIGKPIFTEQEKNDGFSLVWCSYEEALNKMKSDTPSNYVGKFISKRDLHAMEQYKMEEGCLHTAY